MPRYRALRAFGIPGHGRFGHVRAGLVVTMTEKDAYDLNRRHPKNNPIVVPYAGPHDAPENEGMPGSPRNMAIPGAPFVADEALLDDIPDFIRNQDNLKDEQMEKAELGNDQALTAKGDVVKSDRRDGGQVKRSSVSRRVRASRGRT